MSDLLDGLNSKQAEAVTSRSPSILVLAGAGSGKTSVLTKRIAYLIKERGVSASNILALTFTRKAATEMKERISTLIGAGEAKKLWCGTFHAISLRVLEEYGSKIGYHSNISVYDEIDQMDVLDGIIREIGMKGMKGKDVASDLSDYASNCDGHEFDTTTASIIVEYRKRLKSFNAVDFSLLLTETLHLLRNNEEVFKYYHQRFDFVFVDEYQDVDRTQYHLHEAIKPKNFFAVGDFSQAIYTWRGADISIITDFEKDHAGAEVIKLEQCYRCPANVIKAANTLISHNPQPWEMKLWTKNKPLALNYSNFVSPSMEANNIAKIIKGGKESNNFEWSSFVILTRTHSQHAIFLEALEAAHVPYKVVGSELDYWKRTAPRMVISILHFLHNRRDTYNFQKLVKNIIYNFDDAEWLLMEWRALKAEKRLVTYIHDEFHNPGLSELISWYDDNKNEMLSIVIQNVVKHIDLSHYFLIRDLYHKEFELQLLGEHSTEWEHDNESNMTVPAFLQYLAERDLQSEISNDDTVKIATIHAVKGLEFPVVFLAGMNEGKLPHQRAIKAGQVEEERRLCYVAVTRAKHALLLSSTKTETRGRSLIDATPSRFIAELNI